MTMLVFKETEIIDAQTPLLFPFQSQWNSTRHVHPHYDDDRRLSLGACFTLRKYQGRRLPELSNASHQPIQLDTASII